LDHAPHVGLLHWVTDLNRLYRKEPALHELDADPSGFEWVKADDAGQSTLSFLRRSKHGDVVLAVCNFTPVPRHNLVLGAPGAGFWREILNSDATVYGGSGLGNLGGVEAQPISWHGRPYTVNITAPPLAVVLFRRETPGEA